MEKFKAGDDVLVFYRMTKRCRPERKYLAVLDQRHGAYRPRCGISDGWVPARVVADQHEKDNSGDVKVEYTWPFFFTQRGHMADACSGWTEWFPAHHVRKDPDSKRQRLGSLDPKLAILTFRWGGLNEIIAPAQWGETGSSVSDIFIDSYCDHFQQHIGADYEVWTVYIEDKSDMDKVADTAHLLFSGQHPLRRARKVCAMYHLYPTGFEEHCVPTSETGGDGGAALVDQKAFFRMMQAVERAGIPSRFPHDSGLYELLASKRWTYYMALAPHLQLPATIAVPRMLIEQDGADCKQASHFAYKALCQVRRKQQILRGETPSDVPIIKGVAKLGFSWEALDVKFWEGQRGLETAISQLTQTIEISDEITGQPHDLENLIVQEYVDHDLELRLYVVDGEVETTIFTKFCKIKPNNEFGDFKEAFTSAEAAQWIGGDLAALEDGERQCREITEHWMDWVRMQTCQTPPGIRFDYFVGKTAPGKATVRTLEICELGFSMLGKKGLPKKVFSAMLRACLEDETDIADFEDEPEAGSSQVVSESAESEAPEALLEQNGSSMPSVLYITVPRVAHGTPDQVKCTGKYEQVPGTFPNGQALWIHDRGDRFLYAGNDGYWYVGDEEEQDANFCCESGYIRHAGAAGIPPDQLRGPWERGPGWDPEIGILVTTDPEAKPPKLGKGNSKTK